MENFVLLVHCLIAVVMIGLILLQQGKGAEAGASFGAGASQTVFGAAGSASFLTKVTAWLAAVFMVTSLSLAYFAHRDVQAHQKLVLPAALTVPVPTAAGMQKSVMPDISGLPK